MKNQKYFALASILLWGVQTFSGQAAHARLEENSSESSFEFEGRGSAGGSDTGAVSIPCLSDAGEVRNAKAEEVCKAILPKCTDLKKETLRKVRDLLTLKIWGYYKGKDVDLNKSKVNPDGSITLEGADMPNPVCSVVGHRLKDGTLVDAELKTQMIADKKSCGLRPSVIATRRGRKFRLIYEQANGAAGSLWIAYMQGAYPWLIRKNAYQVFNELKDDLSNLDQVIHVDAMSKDIQETVAKMKEFSKSLSREAKSACLAEKSNLLERCKSGAISVNDPAQRACTLVKAQLAANEGALPNMLIYEIMQNRVYGQYDAIFGQILNFKNPTMANLSNACSDTGGFGRVNRKKKLSKTASCFFTGEFCTTDDGTVREAPADGKCASMEKSVLIENGELQPFVNGRVRRFGEKTKSKGFASVIEQLIRHEVCGQNKSSDDNICDKACISSEPNKKMEGCS